MIREITTHSEQETEELARNFARRLTQGDIVTISGDLGVGKTVFSRGIVKYYCPEITVVNSPTFSIVNIYQAQNFSIYHFDLYRIKHIDEIYEAGIEEALNGNLAIIEWHEIIDHILPAKKHKIHISADSVCSRMISFL